MLARLSKALISAFVISLMIIEDAPELLERADRRVDFCFRFVFAVNPALYRVTTAAIIIEGALFLVKQVNDFGLAM